MVVYFVLCEKSRDTLLALFHLQKAVNSDECSVCVCVFVCCECAHRPSTDFRIARLVVNLCLPLYLSLPLSLICDLLHH